MRDVTLHYLIEVLMWTGMGPGMWALSRVFGFREKISKPIWAVAAISWLAFGYHVFLR